MEAQPYSELSDAQLLALCVWREARGEPPEAKLAVACSIRNRVNNPSWWGKDWESVILKPWQYSSFNKNDPNEKKWPSESDSSFTDCTLAANQVFFDDVPDTTNGATHYYDTSISFPKAWGSEAEWENTLNVGRLKFWKMRPPDDLSAEGDV